jgi:acetyltransferase-like isoleucine patch superfamily enzyme
VTSSIGNGGLPSKLEGYVDPRACIGMPPEHRAYRWRSLDAGDPLRFFLPSIHTTAIVEAFASVDAGLERPTVIGPRVYLMKHAHVGHDAIVRDDCNIAPGAIIGGHVTVGAGVKVGLGASIRPRVTIGPGAVIGAGAVVVKDVPAGEVWVGNPAGMLDRRDVTLEREREQRALEWASYDAWVEWYESWHHPTSREGEGP